MSASRTPGIRRRQAYGKIVYQARYETHLGREVARTFDRLADADAWLHEVKQAARRGGALPASRVLKQRSVDLVWRDVQAAKGNDWEATTRSRYRSLYANHVGPYFAGAAVAKVSRSDVRQWAKTLETQKLSSGSVRKAIGLLSLVMREAMEQGIRTDNPTMGTLPRQRPTRQRHHVAVADLGALLSVATGSDRAAWLLMATSGLRFGEMAGLQVGDVDLEAGQVHVRRVIVAPDGKQVVKHYPKGGDGSRRTVGIGAAVADVLRRLVDGREPEVWLWANSVGGPQRYRAAKVRLDAAMGETGQRAAGAGFHSLRRSAATAALQQGASVRDVQAMMGHKSPMMTLTAYAMPDTTEQQQTSEKVMAAIWATPTGQRPDKLPGLGRI